MVGVCKREIQAKSSIEYFAIGSFINNFLKTIHYRQFTDTAKLLSIISHRQHAKTLNQGYRYL